MLISVLIPTYNRCESLKRCFDSLVAQTYKDFEVVIVDGGSTDGTQELIDRYRDKLNIQFTSSKLGLVQTMNTAWQTAKGEIVTRTDDDVVVSPQWLSELARAFSTADNIGGVTGPTLIPEERLEYRDLLYFNQRFREGKSRFWKLIGKFYFDYLLEGQPFAVGKVFRSGAFSVGSNYKECLNIPNIVEVDYLEACNMSLKRELVAQIGGFDEGYKEVAEWHEPDAIYKIKKLGYIMVFNPKAVLWHYMSQSGIYQARTNAFWRPHNFLRFYLKHIKINSWSKFHRVFAYLFFMNSYFIYKFLLTRKFSQLSAIPGTIYGLFKYSFMKRE
ncbi:MAG: glycosyltransferase family 2 protein [bacterium]|nr:glycosyltransferase family 2 protein [bacterium]